MQGVGHPPLYEGSWVQALNRAGYSVAGADLSGHGRSEPFEEDERCYCENFDFYVSEVATLAALIQASA